MNRDDDPGITFGPGCRGSCSILAGFVECLVGTGDDFDASLAFGGLIRC
jgi:hypothetical protein